MKYIILLLCFLCLGIGEKHDQINIIDQMKDTCHSSYLVIDHDLEVKCGSLIDRIEQNKGLEVMSDGKGNFWVESK